MRRPPVRRLARASWSRRSMPAARVGLSFGPHLPRPGTSPMIARELTEFFATFSDGDGADRRARRPGRPGQRLLLERQLAPCCARAGRRCASATSPTRRTRRSRATRWRPGGARRTCPAPACCTRTTIRSPSSCAATSTSTAACARRSATSSRCVRPHAGAHRARPGARRPRATCASTGGGAARAWGLRSARHHAGRALAAALGSRHDRVPPRIARRLSLEGRGGEARSAGGLVRRAGRAAARTATSRCASTRAAARRRSPPLAARRRARRCCTSPGSSRRSAAAAAGTWRCSRIALELERRGHSCSIWIQDDPRDDGRARRARAARDRRALRAAARRRVQHASTTGTAPTWRSPPAGRRRYPVAMLPGLQAEGVPRAGPRAGLLSRVGRAHVGGGHVRPRASRASPPAPGCEQVLRDRYGVARRRCSSTASTSTSTGRPADRGTRATVLFYARPATPRRATELGMLALRGADRAAGRTRAWSCSATASRRPRPFDYEFAGVLRAGRAGAALRPRHRRARALAHQLLAACPRR